MEQQYLIIVLLALLVLSVGTVIYLRARLNYWRDKQQSDEIALQNYKGYLQIRQEALDKASLVIELLEKELPHEIASGRHSALPLLVSADLTSCNWPIEDNSSFAKALAIEDAAIQAYKQNTMNELRISQADWDKSEAVLKTKLSRDVTVSELCIALTLGYI